MKRTVLSAMLATGALAAAALMAVPALTAGTSSDVVSLSDDSGTGSTDNMVKNGGEASAKSIPAGYEVTPAAESQNLDLPETITISLPGLSVALNEAMETNPQAYMVKIDNEKYQIIAEQNEEGSWEFKMPYVALDYGWHTVEIPAGYWSIGRNAQNPAEVEKSEKIVIPYMTKRYKLQPDTESGIFGANYSYTDEKGNKFGYYIQWRVDNYNYWDEEPEGDYSIENAKFCGVISNNEKVEFYPYVIVEEAPIQNFDYYGESRPVKVRNTDGRVNVTTADFRHDIVNEGVETSFPLPQGLTDYHSHPIKDIYLPEIVTVVNWTGKFQTSVRNFHFRSEEVPQFTLDKDADGTVIIRVPEELYRDYKEYIKENYSQYTLVVKSEQPRTPVYVQVDEPGTLAQEIVKLIENLEDVQWIVLSGTPNEEDLRIFRRMPYLEILDMSQVTGLKEVSGLNNLEYLTTVNIPEGVETIGTSAFENCISLESINFPKGITLIKQNAFKECKMLKEIVLPEGLIELEDEAFCHTRGLKKAVLPITLKNIGTNCFIESTVSDINLENVEYFGNGSFAYTPNLKEVNASSAIKIGFQCYEGGAIESILFSDSLEIIGGYAFSDTKMKSLHIPASVKTIQWEILRGVENFKEIIVENSPYLSSWDYRAFQWIRPETIVWKPLFPVENNKFGDDRCFENATLYVPKLTYSNYLLSDAWAGCKRIEKMDEDLDYIYLDREFTLRSEEGLTIDAVFEVGETKAVQDSWDYTLSYGHLTTQRKTDLPLGSFTMSGHMEYSGGGYWDNTPGNMGYLGATVIANSPVIPEQTTLNFSLDTDRWNFVVLPFDVKVSEIDVEDEALWVVRKYSGEDRAKMNGNTWQNLQADDILKAGEGYIFHCSMDGRAEVNFTFHPATDCGQLFNTGNMETPLASYPSEFAHNAHWNLVGNSYPAYLSLKGVNFDAPVTVWDGNTYVAYSPVDDEYAFSPFQAFFVQLQEIEGGDVLTLDARGRAHSREEALALEIEADEENPSTQAERPMLRARRAENRALFNLVLSDGQSADRARLVVNEAASMAYESSRDASKFMSSDNNVPQLFIMNDGERMAIDERPFGEGVYILGARFGHSGEYSVSLDGKNIEGYRAFLTDNLTGVTTEITTVAYAFTADAATDESRFTLELRRDFTTGVEDMEADGIIISAENGVLTVKAPAEVEITVAAADGKVVAIDKSAGFSVELSEGVYVVKAGEAIKKINIR